MPAPKGKEWVLPEGVAQFPEITFFQPITEAQRRAMRLSAAGEGTNTQIAAIRDIIAADTKARDFAQKQIDANKGNIQKFADAVTDRNNRIAAGEAQIAAIFGQRASDAQANAARVKADAEKARIAREEFIKNLIPDEPRGAGTIAGAIERARRGAISATLGSFRARGIIDLGTLDAERQRRTLETQIAEQRFTNEKKLIPFLTREQQLQEERVRILRKTQKGSIAELEAILDLAQTKRRIRDIKTQEAQASGFSLAEFQAAVVSDQAMFGSDVGALGSPLSAQEARGGVAARARPIINQHFYGEQPNPAQALQQASQAARALR